MGRAGLKVVAELGGKYVGGDHDLLAEEIGKVLRRVARWYGYDVDYGDNEALDPLYERIMMAVGEFELVYYKERLEDRSGMPEVPGWLIDNDGKVYVVVWDSVDAAIKIYNVFPGVLSDPKYKGKYVHGEIPKDVIMEFYDNYTPITIGLERMLEGRFKAFIPWYDLEENKLPSDTRRKYERFEYKFGHHNIIGYVIDSNDNLYGIAAKTTGRQGNYKTTFIVEKLGSIRATNTRRRVAQKA
jgi:hypothetical protein